MRSGHVRTSGSFLRGALTHSFRLPESLGFVSRKQQQQQEDGGSRRGPSEDV